MECWSLSFPMLSKAISKQKENLPSVILHSEIVHNPTLGMNEQVRLHSIHLLLLLMRANLCSNFSQPCKQPSSTAMGKSGHISSRHKVVAIKIVFSQDPHPTLLFCCSFFQGEHSFIVRVLMWLHTCIRNPLLVVNGKMNSPILQKPFEK